MPAGSPALPVTRKVYSPTVRDTVPLLGGDIRGRGGGVGAGVGGGAGVGVSVRVGVGAVVTPGVCGARCTVML